MTAKKDFAPAVTREQFDAMTQPQQRVAIMKDVLAQINSARIIPTQGVWAASGPTIFDSIVEIHFERSALVDSGAPQCFACGLGAAFCSAVRLGNECDFRADSADLYAMEDVLERYFPDSQQRAIEFCFETGGCGTYTASDLLEDDDWTEEEVDWFTRFGEQFETPTDRLRAIANNIIANAGTFTPDLSATSGAS